MQELVYQFSQGVCDALRVPDALITICMNSQLRWLNLKCFVLNGLLYLGIVIVYNAFTSMVFIRQADVDENQHQSTETKISDADFTSVIWQAGLTVVHLGMDLLHNSWVMLIYIATLVLTTFWVQDIFDHLMDLKIKQIQKRGDKEKLLDLVKFTPMTPKDLMGDLVARTIIITIYLVLCKLLCAVTKPWLSTLIELVTQSLLIAFYCFEYKTAAASIDTPTGLNLFERQWVYQTGFGFPFTLMMYLTKSVGSSVFFVIFPLLVVISCDENGQGLLLVRNERKTDIKFHLFSLAMQLKDYFLDGITRYIMRQRLPAQTAAFTEIIVADRSTVKESEKTQ